MSREGNGCGLVIELRKIVFQTIELREIHCANVAVVHVVGEIVLVVVLGVVKIGRADDLSGNGVFEDFCRVELLDVCGGDFLLLVGCEENRRAILRADVGALAIFLRWIVRDAEENHQELAVGDFRRVVDDADAFGVASRAGGDELVVRVVNVAAAVAGGRFLNADNVLKHGLRAPKAAAGENGDLRGRLRREGGIKCWNGEWGRRRRGNTGKSACDIPAKRRDESANYQSAAEERRFGVEFHGGVAGYSVIGGSDKRYFNMLDAEADEWIRAA